MAGAEAIGSATERAAAARAAGCDMVLICKQPEQADAILEAQQGQPLEAQASRRVEALRARPIQQDSRRIQALRAQLHHWLAARQAATA